MIDKKKKEKRQRRQKGRDSMNEMNSFQLTKQIKKKERMHDHNEMKKKKTFFF